MYLFLHFCIIVTSPMEYPDRTTIAAMRAWCKAHRGSVLQIASLVQQRDGTVGVHHSAVHRTLSGKENNSRVIAAFYALAGRRWMNRRKSQQTAAQ